MARAPGPAILLFHCIELAEARLAGARPDPITVCALKAATVEKACRFIMRVVVPSTFRFHTEIGSTSAGESHARWVAGHLLSRKLDSISARDVGRAYREIRGDRAEIIATMELLDHAGWVQPHPDRPRDTAWLVNPRIHSTFAFSAVAEKAKREAVREQVRVSIAELAR